MKRQDTRSCCDPHPDIVVAVMQRDVTVEYFDFGCDLFFRILNGFLNYFDLRFNFLFHQGYRSPSGAGVVPYIHVLRKYISSFYMDTRLLYHIYYLKLTH